MTDYFALLDEPRRPWPDPEALKARFLALAAAIHPDRIHDAAEVEKQDATRRYAELNAAYNCLREPKERLLHLLVLERGSKPDDIHKIAPATMDLFAEHSRLCREADAFLVDRARTSSPILKVALLEKATVLTEQLNALRQKLGGRLDALADRIKELNMAWESAPPVGSPTRIHCLPCGRLEHLYREFSHLTRWSRQIQERIVQLSF